MIIQYLELLKYMNNECNLWSVASSSNKNRLIGIDIDDSDYKKQRSSPKNPDRSTPTVIWWYLNYKTTTFKTLMEKLFNLWAPASCCVLAPQVRVSLSGGMNPVSPRARRATLPLGRMVSHVMLPLFRPIRSQPSGGNCRALWEQIEHKHLNTGTSGPLPG